MTREVMPTSSSFFFSLLFFFSFSFSSFFSSFSLGFFFFVYPWARGCSWLLLGPSHAPHKVKKGRDHLRAVRGIMPLLWQWVDLACLRRDGFISLMWEESPLNCELIFFHFIFFYADLQPFLKNHSFSNLVLGSQNFYKEILSKCLFVIKCYI